MKIREVVVTLLFTSFVVAVYATSSCVEVCNQRLKADVAACNNPPREPEELRTCLQTARANFDACKTACGN
jgi:hypothetical protein